MSNREKLENFTLIERAITLVFVLALAGTAINWFADLKWLAPYDGISFGAVLLSGFPLSQYLQDRAASWDKPDDLPAWRYILLSIAMPAWFVFAVLILSPFLD